MQSEQDQIDKLLAFKDRDKFSTEVWNKRGLNPSSNELGNQLTTLFNSCADILIEALKNKSSTRQLKSVLNKGLSKFKKAEYDTEEREFICDLFFELSTIINVDFKDNANKWLYGSALTSLIKISKILRPEKIIETLTQPCSKCNAKLETFIMRKEKGIPETGWFVVKCNNCGELNLLSHGPDVKESRFGNYQWVDTLKMNEYNHEQALVRLEQIKFFRK
jgi:Domain of unknown function (DUF4844)